MADVTLMYRIDIGFDEGRGYAALVTDPIFKRAKAIKGNSIEQLMGRLRHVIIEEEQKRKLFPKESEPSKIITSSANGFQ